MALMTLVAACSFVGLSVLVALFHLALALGAPWGDWAMGGKFPGRLPRAMRFVAAIVIPLYGLLAYLVALRAGILGSQPSYSIVLATWGVVGVMALGTLLNLITPSRKERRLWLPIAFLLFVSSALVAMA